MFLQPRMGGIETYVRRLVPAMLDVAPTLEFQVFLNATGRALLAREPWAGEVQLVTHPFLGRRYTRALSELTVLGPIASRRRIDVLHSVALTGPLWTKPAHVLTIPDVIWLYEPDPAELTTARLWRRIVPPVARRAQRVLTYSEAARADVVSSLAIDPGRIDAVPLGTGDGPVAEPKPPGLSGTLILSVSALKVHKNLRRLVEAMVEVRSAVADAVLVIPGNPTPYGDELRSLAERLGVADGLALPGWVDAGELEGLYAAAACFVFPSQREGFAMRRGVPVACSAKSSLPEVAGDAALYFDPERPSEMARAILRLLKDRALAQRLAEAGHERAGAFTWRRTAEGTLECYERAVKAVRSPPGR